MIWYNDTLITNIYIYILKFHSTYFPNRSLNLIIPKKIFKNKNIQNPLEKHRCTTTINPIHRENHWSIHDTPDSSIFFIYRKLHDPFDDPSKIKAQFDSKFLFHKSILLNLLSLKSTSPYVDWWTHRREHWRTTLAASRSGWPSTWNCRGCSAGETRVLWPVSRLLHAGTRRRRRRRNKRMKIDGERLSALLAVLHRKGERLVPQLFTGNLVSSHTDDTYASFWLIDLLSIFIQFLEIWRSRGK